MTRKDEQLVQNRNVRLQSQHSNNLIAGDAHAQLPTGGKLPINARSQFLKSRNLWSRPLRIAGAFMPDEGDGIKIVHAGRSPFHPAIPVKASSRTQTRIGPSTWKPAFSADR